MHTEYVLDPIFLYGQKLLELLISDPVECFFLFWGHFLGIGHQFKTLNAHKSIDTTAWIVKSVPGTFSTPAIAAILDIMHQGHFWRSMWYISLGGLFTSLDTFCWYIITVEQY